MSLQARILRHLEREGHITPHEALSLYGCYRLAARIWDLRQSGKKIETAYDRFRGTTVYKLAEEHT